MTVQTTTSFNMTLNEILVEGYARAGGEQMTGFDFQTGRISMNLLLADLSTRGLNLWTRERGIQVPSNGVNVYALPTDTLDVVTVYGRQANGLNRRTATLTNPFTTTTSSSTVLVTDTTNGALTGDTVTFTGASAVGGITISGTFYLTTVSANTYTFTNTSAATSAASGGGTVTAAYPATTDIIYTRISMDEYDQLPAKYQPGGPYNYAVNRQIAPSIYLFPTPNGTFQDIAITRQQRLTDVSSGVDNIGVPFFVLPAVISGMAWRLAQKRPQVPADVRRELKALFDEDIERALAEDADPSPIRIEPDFGAYMLR